jgi:hypothetical protein
MKHNDLENRALITLVESLDKQIDRLEIMNEKQFDNISTLVDYIFKTQGMDNLYNVAKEIDEKNGNDDFQTFIAVSVPF